MDRVELLEREIETIKARNQKVQTEKAWEVSLTRLVSIALITYVVACAALYLIHVPNFYLSAFVPVIGFILSTQSLPFIKSWWVKYYQSKV